MAGKWLATVNNQVCLAISSATCNMPSTPATTSSRPSFGICWAEPAGSAAKRKARRRDLKTYAAALYPPRRTHAPCAAHEAGVKLQRVIKRTWQYLRLRDEPRHSSDQQRLRTRVASLRRVPKNHNGFRTEWELSSTRHPLCHRNRSPPFIGASKQSVSPCRSISVQSHSRREVSNYRSCRRGAGKTRPVAHRQRRADADGLDTIIDSIKEKIELRAPRPLASNASQSCR